MHSQPDRVSYSVHPGALRFTLASGESMNVELRPGLWFEAPTHATENIGETETHDVTIELREPERYLLGSTLPCPDGRGGRAHDQGGRKPQ